MTEQTGLFSSGDTDVSVGGATDILGAVIGSEEGDVTIDTGTLTHANLSDHNAYNDFGVSVTLNASMFMPPKTPEETARDVAQQNAACQAIGGCTSPNWTTSGHYAFDDGAQNTNATIGSNAVAGGVSITIRDEAAQAALEDSGQTAGVDEINNDLDTAQVVTRDEHERVDFYLSDSSLQAAADAISFVGKTVTQAFAELTAAMVSQGNLTESERKIFNKVANDIMSGKLSLQDLQTCASGQKQGYNLFDLIFTKAYAANACSGMSPEQLKKCLKYINHVAYRILTESHVGEVSGTVVGIGAAAGGDIKSLGKFAYYNLVIANGVLMPVLQQGEEYQAAEQYFNDIGAMATHAMKNYDQLGSALSGWMKSKDEAYEAALAAGDNFLAGKIKGEVYYRIVTSAALGYGAARALLTRFPKVKGYAAESFHGRTSVNPPNRAPNLNIGGLDNVPSNLANPANIRGDILQHIKSSQRSNVSMATASVEVNGQTRHFISVSGNSWKGNAPDTVTLNGRTYNVVRTDSGSVPSASNGSQTNFNHAEQKLFSHIQNNFGGQNANVNIAVQNTSRQNPGMCQGCSSTSNTFASGNSGFNVNMFQGSTRQNP